MSLGHLQLDPVCFMDICVFLTPFAMDSGVARQTAQGEENAE